MNVDAIVVAAGKGLRFGGQTPKQFLDLAGKPILAYTIAVLNSHPQIERIIVVGAEDWLLYIAEEIVDRYNFEKVHKVVSGGAQRQDSVLAGIQALEKQKGPILIHDGARPFASPEIIEAVINALAENDAAIPGIPVTDTIKVIENDRVKNTVDRSQLRAVQTPQGFYIEKLQNALLRAQKEEIAVTDEAMLMEQFGHSVAIVEGSGKNLKITNEFDLKIAELILKDRAS